MTDADHDDVLERALGGDADAFEELTKQYRGRLFRHCYRMLGSGHDAEEAVQDTLTRAWQRMNTFGNGGSFSSWLYRIATNICIDRLRGRRRRIHPISLGPPARAGSMPQPGGVDLDWIEPAGDVPLGLAGDPAVTTLRRERVSLAFVAALHLLSPRERAALLLHDVLEFTHDEVAEVLATSNSAINSLLYRAREVVKGSVAVASPDPDDPAVKTLLARYVRAWELADISEFVATVSDDVRFSMPPLPTWYEGSDSVAAFVEAAIFGPARPYGVPIGNRSGERSTRSRDLHARARWNHADRRAPGPRRRPRQQQHRCDHLVQGPGPRTALRVPGREGGLTTVSFVKAGRSSTTQTICRAERSSSTAKSVRPPPGPASCGEERRCGRRSRRRRSSCVSTRHSNRTYRGTDRAPDFECRWCD